MVAQPFSYSGGPYSQGTVNLGSIYGPAAGASVAHQTATQAVQGQSIFGLQLPAALVILGAVYLLWRYYE